VDKRTARELFDGVMLGDAGLYHTGTNAQFSLSGSARQNKGVCSDMIEYLCIVRDALSVLGVNWCNGHPKVYNGYSKDMHYLRPTLKSLVCPFLGEQYTRWYRDKGKVVPSDVRVSPVTLAHWFMGDGSSTQDKRCVTVGVTLQTHCFTEDSISILEDRLLNCGIKTGRVTCKFVKSGAGIAISILQESVNQFMNMVCPYVVEPYLYKIKYRHVG